jgi:hypothetical protein
MFVDINSVKSRMPQLKLRTVFFFFVCAAVGLTCASSPAVEVDPQFVGLTEIPQLNWHYGLLAAASVAIVVGVCQEAVYLARWQSDSDAGDIRFARLYAIAWRCTMALVIAACEIVRLLVSRRVISLPVHDDFYLGDLIPDLVWMVGLTVVLTSSLHRFLRNPDRPQPGWLKAGLWFAATCLALIVLPDLGLIQFLVHIAIAGIEWSQPGDYQRVGVYPDQRADGFVLFWMCAIAEAAIVFSAVTLFSCPNHSVTARRWSAAAFGILLAVPIVFCIWYYGFEFHRISPELAATGLASNWLDRLGGAIIATVAISVGAYYLARGDQTVSLTDVNSVRPESLALQESFVVLIVLALASMMYLWEINEDFWGINIGLGIPGFAGVFMYSFQDPVQLLYTAFCILSLQLAWKRWRRRNEPTAWRLSSLNWRAYVWNWFACAALVAVAVPTTAAYCFVFWLGPWYLYGP